MFVAKIVTKGNMRKLRMTDIVCRSDDIGALIAAEIHATINVTIGSYE